MDYRPDKIQMTTLQNDTVESYYQRSKSKLSQNRNHGRVNTEEEDRIQNKMQLNKFRNMADNSLTSLVDPSY